MFDQGDPLPKIPVHFEGDLLSGRNPAPMFCFLVSR